MKKIFFMAAVAALALSSCSSTEEVLNAPEQVAENAISFDIYQARTVSRAAVSVTGVTADADLDFTNLEANDLANTNVGFGVYAWNTGSMDFDAYVTNNTYPNFMLAQKVTYDNDASPKHWKYTPVKYWPNNGDKLSFLAFAPYKVVTTKAKAAVGVEGEDGYEPAVPEVSFNVADRAIISNHYNGVGIRYNVKDNYDLLYSTNKFLDQTKPAVGDGQTKKFSFAHGLAWVDVTVSYNVDNTDCTLNADIADAKNKLDTNTKIVVRSVKLLGNVATQGVLSLYDGQWTIEQTEENKYAWGKSAFDKNVTGKAITAYKTEGTPLGGDAGTLTTDVQKIWTSTPLLAIPFTDLDDHKFAVQVVYDVITTDDETHNSSTVTNVINSYEAYQNTTGHTNAGYVTIEQNTKTTINIHLGLETAKFDAEVEPWSPTAAETNVDAPQNK